MTVVLDMLGPAHGGATVARLGGSDGRVVFVRGALPGETGVPVELDTDPETSRKRFLTGQVTDSADIVGPSPHRRAPVCRAAALGAGCCDLDFIDASGSLELKTRVVVEQFSRIGGIDLSQSTESTENTDSGPRVDVVAPEPFTGYRTRVRLGVDQQGRAGLRVRAGRDIVALEDLEDLDDAVCAQWSPELSEGLVDVLADADLTPGAEVCVAVGADGGRGIVEVPATRQQNRRRGPQGKRHRKGRGKGPQRIPRRVIASDDASHRGTVERTVTAVGSSDSPGPVSWQLPVESFWQAHTAAPGLYSDWVRDKVTATSGEAWDLYGGAGVFAAALTGTAPDGVARGLHVTSVDLASAATRAGQDVLEHRDVSFVTGDVATVVPELATQDPAVVVLDPPRTGAGAAVIESVMARRPDQVLHIGCDPATAARDSAAFIAGGYRIDSVTVVDAFGLTHHVEVLVEFSRAR